MSKCKRVGYRVRDRFQDDLRDLVVRYEVEGETDRVLHVETLLPVEVEEGGAAFDAILEGCDEEAEWSAEHPDAIPTAQLVGVG